MVIVFSAFKIIGILLLVFALVMAVILLVPVLYTFDGNIDEGDYTFRVNWFFKLIRFRFRYQEKMEAILWILFVKLDFTDPEKKEKREKRKAKRAAKKKKKSDREKEKKRKALEKEREKNRREINLDPESETVSGQMQDGEREAKFTAEAATIVEEGSEAAGIKIPENVKKALHILRAVYESQVFDAVFPRLQIFLLHIRPRQLKGHVEFGFSDPATTGQVLGAIAVIPFLFGTELSIYPDFETEKTYVSGNVHVKGRMFLIHLVIFMIRLLLDKKVRRFLSMARRKKK